MTAGGPEPPGPRAATFGIGGELIAGARPGRGSLRQPSREAGAPREGEAYGFRVIITGKPPEPYTNGFDISSQAPSIK